jgi:hypothetical protein
MTDLSASTGGRAVAAAGDFNPYAAYAEQATGGARNIVKFRKGRFFYGQDDVEIPPGTRLVADMAGARVGWVRWRDGRPTDEVMVLIGEGVAPPRRDELGDRDRELWETDERGDPKDPWQLTNHLPLIGPETGDRFLFATSTRGGIGAIGVLAKAYGTLYRQKPGKLPVVELEASDYAHPNKAYGRVDVPVLELVDWVEEAGFLTPAPEAPEPEPRREPPRAADAMQQGSDSGAGRRTRF